MDDFHLLPYNAGCMNVDNELVSSLADRNDGLVEQTTDPYVEPEATDLSSFFSSFLKSHETHSLCFTKGPNASITVQSNSIHLRAAIVDDEDTADLTQSMDDTAAAFTFPTLLPESNFYMETLLPWGSPNDLGRFGFAAAQQIPSNSDDNNNTTVVHTDKSTVFANLIPVATYILSNDLDEVVPEEWEIDATANEREKNALANWYYMFRCMQQYKAKYGNCNVPQKYPENESLGNWVNKQRTHLRGMSKGGKPKLNSRQMALLDKIGFKHANPRGKDCWDLRYAELKVFHQLYGHTFVPTKPTKESDMKWKKLGRWVTSMRSAYKKGGLTTEQIDDLNRLDFSFDGLQSQFS